MPGRVIPGEPKVLTVVALPKSPQIPAPVVEFIQISMVCAQQLTLPEA